MAILRALLFVSSAIVILAPAIALAQSSLDFSLPASSPINSTTAYAQNNMAVSVYGDIRLLNYDTGTYVAIPTDAPDGTILAFFQDTGTMTLFQNNTLLLPISDGRDRVASLVLTTGDMKCNSGMFLGQVTGLEVDTKAMDDSDATANAILYLSQWPEHTEYKLSLSDNAQIKKAIQDTADNSSDAGNVKLMLNVSGDSIGYVIVRMKAPEAAGNVTAYRYYGGSVTKLTGRKIPANGSVVYETIYSGPGTFAFVGPFPEPAHTLAGLPDTLLFWSLEAALVLLAGTMIIFLIKRRKLRKKG